MSTQQKVVLRYSTAFKLKVVEQIERGELTIAEARRVYDIRGNQTIQKWLTKHGKSHLLSRVVRVQMKDEKDRIKQLEAEKKKLESALAQAHVKNLFLEELITLAKEEYDIDLKKKLRHKAVQELSRREEASVNRLCEAAQMSRQAYYKWSKKSRLWNRLEAWLLKLVRTVRKLMPQLGGRKIFHELRRILPFGRDRFFDWLRQHGLLAMIKRRFPATTYSKHALKKFRNLIRELEVKTPGQVIVSDITYIALEDGKFAYASLVTDAFSRKIVGYHLSSDLSVAGPLKALRMALRSVPDSGGLIHHSDRGVQYCSKSYIDELERNGVAVSMTERQHCAENAMAERVNGILKHEFGLKNRFRTIAAARKALHQAVWIYNNLRPHLSLNYKKPADVHAA